MKDQVPQLRLACVLIRGLEDRNLQGRKCREAEVLEAEAEANTLVGLRCAAEDLLRVQYCLHLLVEAAYSCLAFGSKLFVIARGCFLWLGQESCQS